jgi:hypothetical protein
VAVTGDLACPTPACDFATTRELARRQHVKFKHPELVGEANVSRETSANPFDGTPEEPKPEAKKGLFSGLFKPKPSRPAKPPREQRPKRSFGKRVSAATILGAPFEFAGEAVQGQLPATARMLAVQAPYAGYVLDEAVAGTIVDKVAFQPLARAQDRLGMVGSVIGPPLLVARIEMHPEQMHSLVPLLKRSLRMAAPYIAKGLKKKKEDDAKLAEVLTELYPDLPPGTDPLDAMLSDILAPIFTRPAPAPEEEPVP